MLYVEKSFVENLDKMALLLKKVDDFGAENETSKKERKKFTIFKTHYASNLVLLTQRHGIEDLQHHGLLMDLDADPLLKQINEKIERIVLAPLMLTVDEFVHWTHKVQLNERFPALKRSISRMSYPSNGASASPSRRPTYHVATASTTTVSAFEDGLAAEQSASSVSVSSH